jgi:hypothetical protein
LLRYTSATHLKIQLRLLRSGIRGYDYKKARGNYLMINVTILAIGGGLIFLIMAVTALTRPAVKKPALWPVVYFHPDWATSHNSPIDMATPTALLARREIPKNVLMEDHGTQAAGMPVAPPAHAPSPYFDGEDTSKQRHKGATPHSGVDVRPDMTTNPMPFQVGEARRHIEESKAKTDDTNLRRPDGLADSMDVTNKIPKVAKPKDKE